MNLPAGRPRASIIPVLPDPAFRAAAAADAQAATLAATDAVINAVLQQAARELQQLARNAAHVAVIDLNALMDAAARARLRACLGQGEATAQVRSAALTQWHETACAGCWWQRQGSVAAMADDASALEALPRDASALEALPDDASALEALVIARVPALLAAPADDITDAAARLAQLAAAGIERRAAS